MSVTPNMILTLPDVSVTPGPEWAATLNAALAAIDDHDHTSGKGKLVPISGVDINQNLDMQTLEIVDTKSVNFQNLVSALSGVLNINKLQVINGNVWFTNSGGVPVQITDGNAIVSTVVIPASPLMPSGTVLDFAGSAASVGFLLCDGAAVSRVTYSSLFAAIGTAWGVGDGTSTFNLPNFNGRTSVGSGTYTDTVSGSVSRSIAQKIGTEKHVLTQAELASHTHIQDAHSHTYPQGASAGAGGFLIPGRVAGTDFPIVTSITVSSTVATNQNTGNDVAHNNMQPSLVILKMIKT